MDSYIMLEGKKIPLTDEQIKILKSVEGHDKSPFERVGKRQTYYYVGSNGCVGVICENGDIEDDEYFNAANYCADRELTEQRALQETLNRLLWRYSMEHGGYKDEWDGKDLRYSIGIDVRDNKRELKVADGNCWKMCGLVYFPSEDVAKAAIKEVVKPFLENHPDFEV
jgi:hypothetical protein